LLTYIEIFKTFSPASYFCLSKVYTKSSAITETVHI